MKDFIALNIINFADMTRREKLCYPDTCRGTRIRVGYVSDTDTPWIRHRYVSKEYPKKNKKQKIGYVTGYVFRLPIRRREKGEPAGAVPLPPQQVGPRAAWTRQRMGAPARRW